MKINVTLLALATLLNDALGGWICNNGFLKCQVTLKPPYHELKVCAGTGFGNGWYKKEDCSKSGKVCVQPKEWEGQAYCGDASEAQVG